jgi:hypothetical protein
MIHNAVPYDHVQILYLNEIIYCGAMVRKGTVSKFNIGCKIQSSDIYESAKKIVRYKMRAAIWRIFSSSYLQRRNTFCRLTLESGVGGGQRLSDFPSGCKRRRRRGISLPNPDFPSRPIGGRLSLQRPRPPPSPISAGL